RADLYLSVRWCQQHADEVARPQAWRFFDRRLWNQWQLAGAVSLSGGLGLLSCFARRQTVPALGVAVSLPFRLWRASCITCIAGQQLEKSLSQPGCSSFQVSRLDYAGSGERGVFRKNA